MILDFSKIKLIPGGKLEFQFEEALDPLAYGFGEFQLKEAVSCQGQALHAEGSFRVEGQYHTMTELSCSRCGQLFQSPAAGEFSVCFVSGNQVDWDGEQDLYELSGDAADLGPVIAGEIFFSLPMQPLCREDCRGLCPHCGINLNENSCSCREEEIDPRWEKLKDLLNQD
ncbi:MAG: DUF177 domain-containing protein [Bacillota bacterium]|nr:DUF177 domain-containing protein [Bacillota bacterium]